MTVTSKTGTDPIETYADPRPPIEVPSGTPAEGTVALGACTWDSCRGLRRLHHHRRIRRLHRPRHTLSGELDADDRDRLMQIATMTGKEHDDR